MNHCVACGEILTSGHRCNEERIRRIEAGYKAAGTRAEEEGWSPNEIERLNYGLSLLDFQE